MRWLKSLLTSPVFDDETKTNRAFMLHVILWALIVAPLLYVPWVSLASPSEAPRAFVQVSISEVINVFLFYLLRRGRLRLAAILQVTTIWLFFTVIAATGSGVRGPAYMLSNSFVIMLAGILLGGRELGFSPRWPW